MNCYMHLSLTVAAFCPLRCHRLTDAVPGVLGAGMLNQAQGMNTMELELLNTKVSTPPVNYI